MARNAILVAGLAASIVALLAIVALGVWPGDLNGDAGLAVAGATLPGVAAIIAHLYRDARLGRERQRRLVDLNVQMRKQEALLERMAMTDPLTGVYNRRYFHERLNLEIGRTARYGRPLALALIDLDHFKAINDTHGHPFGDIVLAETARLLVASLRGSDAVARYGGEEFAVLLPETDLDQAEAVAEKLRETVAEHEFRHGNIATSVTLSIGVTGIEAGALSAPDGSMGGDTALVARADAALYDAKRRGRNRVIRSPDGDSTRRQA